MLRDPPILHAMVKSMSKCVFLKLDDSSCKGSECLSSVVLR